MNPENVAPQAFIRQGFYQAVGAALFTGSVLLVVGAISYLTRPKQQAAAHAGCGCGGAQ